MQQFLQDFKQIINDAGGKIEAMSGVSYLQDQKTNVKNSLISYLKSLFLPALTRAVMESSKVYYLVLTDTHLIYQVYADGQLDKKLNFELNKITDLTIGTAHKMIRLAFQYEGSTKVYHLHNAVFYPDGSYSNNYEDIEKMRNLQQQLLDKLKKAGNCLKIKLF